MVAAGVMCLTVWLGAVPVAVPGTLLQTIDGRHSRGAVDTETWHYLRLAAVRDRNLLPEDLKVLRIEPDGLHQMTRIAVEAFQYVERTGAFGGRLHLLLLQPEDLPYVLDSSTLPIRVSYENPGDVTRAQQTLEAAEHSWQVLTGQWGFYTPLIEPGAQRYRFRVTPTGFGGGGYTAPFAVNPATPRADCYTYIVIDPSNGSGTVGSVTAHELTHAMQAAMDCEEITTFWENTATYLMAVLYPDDYNGLSTRIPFFQSKPWFALDYMSERQSDYYEYGGALFPLFLASAYAPTDGPVLMRQIWEAAMQDEASNSKHYLTAVKEAVAARGGPDTFEEIFMEFSEARYFISSKDDGQHMAGAGELEGCEVDISAAHSVVDLPVDIRNGPEGKQPAHYGVNYVELALGSGYGRGLRIHFRGDSSTRWNVNVLMIGSRTTTRAVPLPVGVDGVGQVDVVPAGYPRVVLVIANLATPTYSPNARSWPPGLYQYSLDSFVAPPVVEGASPAQLPRGTNGASVELKGSSFANGPDFAVAFDDPGVVVDSVVTVQATYVRLKVSVTAEAALGPHSVTVTNSGGLRNTSSGVLTVTEALLPDAGVAGSDGGSGTGTEDSKEEAGCASSQTAFDSGPSVAWFLVVLALSRRAGRRRSER